MSARNHATVEEIVNERKIVDITRGVAASFYKALLCATFDAGPRKPGVYNNISEADLDEVANAMATDAYTQITDSGVYKADDRFSLSENLQYLMRASFLPRTGKLIDAQKRIYKAKHPGHVALLEQAKRYYRHLPELA